MDDVADAFAWYADWAADVSPLYERLARGVVDRPALLDIASEASEGQPPPQLLLASVHALLLAGRDHRLAAFYPTCVDDPNDPSESDPVPAFADFCLAHEDRLRELVRSRRVQTNAVGRSAVLVPAFERVRRAGASAPLATVEVGASAGLNLRWDAYRYEYGDVGAVGDPEAPVRIETAVRGETDPPLPDSMPAIGHRVGIDLNPLDAGDPADRRWLKALVIPDQQRRFERLAGALAAAKDDPPSLVAGDALAVLPAVLDEVPDDTALCVFSTHTLYQLADDEVDSLRGILERRSHDRPVTWLCGDPDWDGDGQGYRHVRFVAGEATERRLAAHESYGRWLRWLEDRDRGD